MGATLKEERKEGGPDEMGSRTCCVDAPHAGIAKQDHRLSLRILGCLQYLY